MPHCCILLPKPLHFPDDIRCFSQPREIWFASVGSQCRSPLNSTHVYELHDKLQPTVRGRCRKFVWRKKYSYVVIASIFQQSVIPILTISDGFELYTHRSCSHLSQARSRRQRHPRRTRTLLDNLRKPAPNHNEGEVSSPIDSRGVRR